jgi:hypothetical protein
MMRWPVLWPGVFGSHELFHLWVMAGSTAHFWFMMTAVVPIACAARSEAEAVPAWNPDGSQQPRTVFRFNPLWNRLHHG